MPELPEVEYATRRLAEATRGKRIASARALHRSIEKTLPAADAARLADRDVLGVTRAGKYQLMTLSGDTLLVAHFRMAGDWHAGASDELPRHARAALDFVGGSSIFLVDSRALATLAVRPADDPGLPSLGPDAADPTLTGALLGARLAARRVAIKPLLLDQGVIAGLGNIYAAEALWGAAISPFALPAALTAADYDRLVVAIRATLDTARLDPGRYSRGEATERLNVYGRAGEACSRCGTAIERTVQAGRSTYHCPGCQLAGVPRRTASRAPRRARP